MISKERLEEYKLPGMKQINHVYVVQRKWLLDCVTKINGTVSDREKINDVLKLLVKKAEI